MSTSTEAFPPRILKHLQKLADTQGTGCRSDSNGLPLQDDASAALAWIAQRAETAAPVAEPVGHFSINDYGLWEQEETPSKSAIPLYAAPPSSPAPTGEALSGWIGVDERLPGEQGQDSEDVLCFLNGHCALTDFECRAGGAWGIRIGYYDADIGTFRVHGRPEGDVTHWQPLPAHPALKEKP